MPSSTSTPLANIEQATRSRSKSLTSNTPAAAAAVSKSDAQSVTERLQSMGMKSVAWTGKCEADIVSMGRYDVPEAEGGMYGMVFDNTHSKQLSKTVTFVVMTFPTDAPPKSGHQAHFKQAMARRSSTTLGKASPSLPASESSENLPAQVVNGKMSNQDLQSKVSKGAEFDTIGGEPTFFTGVLSKKRRKRNQGWAKRFFSLDFTSSTLSYYKNRNSSALRGAVPLSLAAVGADEKSRQISIDSGTEIWILRALNKQDFVAWRAALERASRSETPTVDSDPSPRQAPTPFTEAEDREWGTAETLVGKVAGITDSVRRLAKDTDARGAAGLGIRAESPAGSPSPGEHDQVDYFNTASRSPERSHFWKRKPSTGNPSPTGMFRRSVSAQKLATSSSLAIPAANHALNVQKQRGVSPHQHQRPEDIHERCAAVLRDLDAVVSEFSALIAQSRRRRQPERPSAVSRKSMESTRSVDEFYDADDGTANSRSQILRIRGDSELDQGAMGQDEAFVDAEEADDSDSDSELDEADDSRSRQGHSALFPPKTKTLSPLPKPPVTRRSTIPAAVGTPPSLIAFLRKNVGKDLSTISMPVTANEPLSLLQRQAEQMEYSELLDAAVSASPETGERLLYITAFALSSLSNSRLKERAIRKPFNPMLGETYELVREDKGFRFLAEKVTHRPVRVACQAEAKDWTFTHSPSPTQKFWGKSAEINTDGKARVVLHASGDCYSWTPATCFLRNIIAGEKYVEPVQSMTVLEETTGRKAVATFKSGGMFSGRSEDVTVQAFDAAGSPLPLGLQGKWTTHLTLTSGSHSHAAGAGTDIWTVGALVKDAPKRYGMTAFAATLNEVTSLESALPPTDSRKRPDQRVYEEGAVDEAERMKAALEESQRRRRKEMETAGQSWEPVWFQKVGRDGDEDVWCMRGEGEGKDYWSVRQAVTDFKKGQWDGVREVFEL